MMKNPWLNSQGQGIKKLNCITEIGEGLRDLQPDAISDEMKRIGNILKDEDRWGEGEMEMIMYKVFEAHRNNLI